MKALVEDLLQLARLDGDAVAEVTVFHPAVFAAAVKHSPLLGDFLDIVVGEHYRLFRPALSHALAAGAVVQVTPKGAVPSEPIAVPAPPLPTGR